MAVKINFTTKYGVDGEYINFDPQIANKTSVNLKMKYWKDKTTRDTEGTLPFNNQMAGSGDERITGFKCNYSFEYDLNSVKNVYQQGYDYLKTLPEFAEAMDDITEEQSTQMEAVNSAQLSIRNIR
jgi:FlaG/FlaF family flagellin (archaellin)